ncbi:RNA polymerase recycling motor HelD [Paenibacillus sp.]|uniref:RNA polymerase recycling motor HelD n=1 Tax=Paenibacillus sp. TaxID=58172 RepID=UPI002D305894|nr:RNA polymerase recycling motor HelD [Paenibacillus sp.]HZG58356.1 RNA polymerase recycling motor HelD [Paenibacillus sp.]
MLTKDPWEQERSRYEQVRRFVSKRIAMLEPDVGEGRTQVVELRRRFWDDVSVNLDSFDDRLESYVSLKQQAELLGERERAHRTRALELASLRRARIAPYFGFVAFREDGASDAASVYIGSSTLLDDDGETFLVYDWRAPVASLYYDFPPGDASYETPGGTIRGVLERKLQFLSEEGRLIGVFDSDVAIGDQLLAHMVAQTSDARMKTIVSTIQKEQNAAIRNDAAKLLVVHGPAGSGKTSAALQRVAYLLYKHRNTLQSRHMLLFSPNSMFMSYVDTVLPELGEEPIGQATFPDYVQYRLGTSFRLSHPLDELEARLAGADGADAGTADETVVAAAKAEPDFLRAIEHAVASLPDAAFPFRAVRMDGKTLIDAATVADTFAATDRRRRLPDRLAETSKRLLGKLTELEQESLDEDWVTERVEAADSEMLRQAYKELRRRQRGANAAFNEGELEERILREMVAKARFAPLRRRVKRLRFVDVPRLYLSLLAAYLPDDPAWRVGVERTAAAFAQGTMPYEDAAPYLALQDALNGIPERRDVRHVVIDEAQDYSPLQLEYIKRLFPSARMTIVGDFRQAIFPFAAALEDEAALARLFGEAETAVAAFRRCYRSTRELVEFTRRLLADGGADIEPFERPGERPAIVFAENRGAVEEAIAEDVRRLRQDGYGSIGILCKTAAAAAAAYERLRPRIDGLELVARDATRFPPGACVVPTYLAKGVEFDAVLIEDASASAYGKAAERKLFYTACTRAMHRLRLYVAGRPSPFLEGVPAEAYVTERR